MVRRTGYKLAAGWNFTPPAWAVQKKPIGAIARGSRAWVTKGISEEVE